MLRISPILFAMDVDEWPDLHLIDEKHWEYSTPPSKRAKFRAAEADMRDQIADTMFVARVTTKRGNLHLLDDLDLEQLHARLTDVCEDLGWEQVPQFERTKGKVLGLVLARFKPVVYDTSSLELTYQSAEERILSVSPLFEFHE